VLASGCYRLHFYIVFHKCLNHVLEDHLSRYFAHQELISIGKGCPKLKYYARPFWCRYFFMHGHVRTMREVVQYYARDYARRSRAGILTMRGAVGNVTH
jgi:hypothetical protein